MINHLVTSGCSFSDNFDKRWPHFLAEELNVTLYNRGHGGAGNDWISKSLIYQLQILLDSGIDPSEILAIPMWSGIDRKSIFISFDNYDFKGLMNDPTGHPNPVNFIDEKPNIECKHNLKDGYLVGSMNCNFTNFYIREFKTELISKFFNDEALAIESYENFLRVQWYCESKGITLLNHTYMNIMHYPFYRIGSLTYQKFRNIDHLYKMINFENWLFSKDYDGLYEFTKNNNLEFYNDNLHPSTEAHKYYVENYLVPALKGKNIL